MKTLSKTLFIPLYFRYLESISTKNIYDKEAVNFFNTNADDIVDFTSFRDDVNTYAGTIARTLLIDKYLLSSIALFQGEKFNIINIGCGLDFRNRRLDLHSIPIINVDLKEVIEFRNNSFPAHPDENNKVGDITNIKNWDFIPKENNIFILEGILMYFSEKTIKEIFLTLKEKSNNSIFIFEVLPEINSNIKHPTVSKIDKNLNMQWGCNNIQKFVKDLGFQYLDSETTTALLQDRWNFKLLDSLLGNAKEVLNNHRIVWMKS